MARVLGLLKYKTTWSGLAMLSAGIYMLKSGNSETGIQTIIGGLALIFIREAIQKIGSKQE